MNTEVKRIQITLSELINDLDNGLTWLRKDDAGDGSIQEKYGLSDKKTHVISQHPKLVGLEPNLLIVEIVDDLKNESNVSTEPATEPESGISDTSGEAEGRNSSELPLDNSKELLASNGTADATPKANDTVTTTSSSTKSTESNTDESKQEEFSNFMSL